jgi:ankyrin repeat protein
MQVKKFGLFTSLILVATTLYCAEDPKEKALLHSAVNGNFSEVREILKEKIDVNTPSLRTSPLNAIVQLQADVALGRSPLRPETATALCETHLLLVSLFLKNNANLNKRSGLQEYAPLHNAILIPDRRFFDLLMRENADPNVLDKDGNTPLHRLFLVHKNKTTVADVNLLLFHGANPMLRNKAGQSILDLAKQFGASPEVIQVIVEYETKQRLPESPV